MVNIKNRHRGKSKQKSTPNGADRNKKSQTKEQFIGDIDEAPDFLKDNEYILTGYRIGFNDFKSAIKSLFMYHNETTNVWTHFIGVMLFFGLMLYICTFTNLDLYSARQEIVDNFGETIDDALENQDHECLDHSLKLSEQIRNNLPPCTLYDQIYANSIDLWHQEVEVKGFEYFSKNSCLDPYLEERKKIETTSSLSRFMLLERDPYQEVVRQIEYFFHTEADTIEDLTNKYNLEPDMVIQVVNSISHYCQERINSELSTCLKSEEQNPRFSKDSYESQLVENMKLTYQNLEKIVANHFDEFIKRMIIQYKLHSFQNYFNTNEIYESKDHHNTQMEVSIIPLVLHMIAAMTCLGLSSVFHLFCCHSEHCHTVLSRLDYGGIVILIGGSTIPPFIYGFYCGRLWYFGVFYTVAIDSICLVAFICSLLPAFDQPRYRNIRAVLFVLVGLFSGLPGLHAALFRDPFITPPMTISLWALGGAVYVSGAFIYAFRFPEKFFPGKFCKFGNSHNIWHCFVLAGAIIHFFASLNDYHVRVMFPCPPE